MDLVKVLIVEDEPFLRDMYIDILTAEKYNVDSAIDGEQAFEKIKQGGWNLILLDILMPKMNAFEVLEKLDHDADYLARIKPTNKCLVFLTNLDSEADIKKALSLGNGYLIKSQITPGDLIKEVKMYLEKGSSPDTPQSQTLTI